METLQTLEIHMKVLQRTLGRYLMKNSTKYFPFYHSMRATIVTVDSKRASASMELSSQESATRITNIYVHEHDFDKFGQKSFASIMSELGTHEGLNTKRYVIQGVFLICHSHFF